VSDLDPYIYYITATPPKMPTPGTPDLKPGSIKTTEGKVFCTYCGRGFTRKEHLERHLPQREHTQVCTYTPSAHTDTSVQTRTSNPTAAARANWGLLEGE
jgi:uncharacterized Zn finger protein (UPF0148 family)